MMFWWVEVSRGRDCQTKASAYRAFTVCRCSLSTSDKPFYNSEGHSKCSSMCYPWHHRGHFLVTYIHKHSPARESQRWWHTYVLLLSRQVFALSSTESPHPAHPWFRSGSTVASDREREGGGGSVRRNAPRQYKAHTHTTLRGRDWSSPCVCSRDVISGSIRLNESKPPPLPPREEDGSC